MHKSTAEAVSQLDVYTKARMPGEWYYTGGLQKKLLLLDDNRLEGNERIIMFATHEGLVNLTVFEMGCFYHLTQSTYRKVQELGLQTQYRENQNLIEFCGKMDGLALLPIGDVKDVLRNCPPNLWNVNESSLNDEERTNNSTEGWNIRFSFSKLVGQTHSTIWTIINKIKLEVTSDETKLAQIELGVPQQKR
ncbi:Uncharacterized protein FWK35_00005596 [Aphis craccivora]|uniref:Uncharacterized protein n=1 Tax=Aphis craccivora TaxID=307492 RepID=A0A6G0Z304_APHCR|nr:Uncharacterized protein FWK35_00005596 [Aphis craccivora]